jgi:molybdopterin synthase sulfur carrier subunit
MYLIFKRVPKDLKITVRFYGVAYENTGSREYHLELGEGASIRALLKEIVDEYPKLSSLVYDEAGALRDYFAISVNNVDIQGLDGWDTLLSKGDVVFVMPPIGGG